MSAQSRAPIIVKGPNGQITEALFTKSRDLAHFERARHARHSEEHWKAFEKRVSTDLKGLRWGLELGPALQHLALKMVIAASTLLPDFGQNERASACAVLQGDLVNPHPLVAHYLRAAEVLAAKRPALSHTLYVEHQAEQAHGIVEFFGVFRFFVRLSTRSTPPGAHAVFAYLDPVEACESFEVMPPVGLTAPPAFYTAQELIGHQVSMVQDLVVSAIARGATTVPEVQLTAHLPDNGHP